MLDMLDEPDRDWCIDVTMTRDNHMADVRRLVVPLSVQGRQNSRLRPGAHCAADAPSAGTDGGTQTGALSRAHGSDMPLTNLLTRHSLAV
jgi:hypothetical protein